MLDYMDNTSGTDFVGTSQFMENVTSYPGDHNLSNSTSDIIYYVYYYGLIFVISVVAVFGNGVALYVFISHRYLRIPGNYFMISLCVSDLLLGFVYPVYNISHINNEAIIKTMGKWHFCTVWLTLTVSLVTVSAYNMLGITVIRYISIQNPLRFVAYWTHMKGLVSCLCVWLFLIAITSALFLKPFREHENYTGLCRFELVLNMLHILYMTVFSVVIPLVIMTTLYGLMAMKARKHAIAIAAQARAVACEPSSLSAVGDTTKRHVIKRELRMFGVVGLLLGYFTLALVPFVIFEFISMTCHCDVNRYIRATVRLLLHSNTAANTIIYAYRLPEVRDTINQIIKQAKCHLKVVPQA